MDPRLAEIYGTNEDTSDVEKTAAAELAEKLAGENETNIDKMSDEEIEALAKEVLSADEEEQKEPTEEDGEKVAEAKVAEADHLGRVMAHAYVQELKNIDKEASTTKTASKSKLSMKMKKAMDEKDEKKDEKKDDKKDKKLPPFMKKEKKSSALDTLAVERAKEILAANGFEPAEQDEEKPAEEKKAATKADMLAQAVEARAVEILKAEGYEFEEE